MASFNYIPDHLREEERPDWTLEKGRRRGALYTTLATAILAVMAAIVGYVMPLMTRTLVLNWAFGLVTAFALFAVMRKASNTIDSWCLLMVPAFALVPLVANHVGICVNLAQSADTAVAFARGSLRPMHLVACNYPALIGIGIASFLCKDGDYSLLDFVEALLINPLTGRRR